MEEEHDSPIAMRVYVRDEVFHLTTSQIAFDSPESNLFSTSLARGVRVLKSDMSPSLFSLIIDHLSGYPIFPLPPSTNVNLNYLLLDAQRLGLDDLERMVKKEMFRTKSLPFLDREHVRNLVATSTTGNGSGSGSEPLDVTRLLKNPEMFASISEVVEPTLEDDEGIYKLSQISVSMTFSKVTTEDSDKEEERCEITLKSQHPFKYIEFPTVHIPKRLWGTLPIYLLKEGGGMEKLTVEEMRSKFGDGPTLLSAITIILIATECQGRFYQLKGFLGMIAYALKDVVGNLMELLHSSH